MCVNNLLRAVNVERSGRESNLRPLGCQSVALTTTSPRHHHSSWSRPDFKFEHFGIIRFRVMLRTDRQINVSNVLPTPSVGVLIIPTSCPQSLEPYGLALCQAQGAYISYNWRPSARRPCSSSRWKIYGFMASTREVLNSIKSARNALHSRSVPSTRWDT